MLLIVSLLLAAGLWFGLRKLKAHINKIDTVAAGMAAKMDKDEAEDAYTEAAETASKKYVLYLTSPLWNRFQYREDAILWIYKAAACRDRVHELTGHQHGPDCRTFIRAEITQELTKAAKAFMSKVEAETLRRKMSA